MLMYLESFEKNYLLNKHQIRRRRKLKKIIFYQRLIKTLGVPGTIYTSPTLRMFEIFRIGGNYENIKNETR